MKREWISRLFLHRARRAGDVGQQFELLMAAIRHHPVNRDAHRLLLSVAKKCHRLADLLPFYHDLAQQYPEVAMVANYWGAVYHLLGELHIAEAKFVLAKTLDPNLVSARNNLALVAGFYGRYDEAISELEYCLTLNPNDSDVHGNLGMDYHSIGRLDEALAHLTRAVELDPTPYRMNVLADFYLQQNDYSRARYWYRRGQEKEQIALTMDLRHVSTLVNLAHCYLRGKDYAGCNEILERCLAVPGGENSLSLQMKAGEAYLEQQLYPKAIFHFERARALALDNNLILGGIYRSLSKVYYMTGEFHLSVTSFQLASAHRQAALGQDLDWFADLALANHATCPDALPPSPFRNVQLLYEQGHWEKALHELLAMEPHPDARGDLNMLIGWTCLLLGDTTRAWRYIYRGLYARNDSPAPFLLAGAAALYEGSYAYASFYLRHALSLNDQIATAWRLLGHVNGAQADYSQALACYHRAKELEPGEIDIHCCLADAYLRLGQQDDALAHLNILLDRQPQHLIGLALQARLSSELAG